MIPGAGEAGHGQGCLLCGAEIAYRVEAAPMTCATCGAERASTARCRAGHFVCDACHAGAGKELIARACAESRSTDAVEIATQLMRHPSVKMHGPEHHFLVPAALLAAWANAAGRGDEKERLLAEARRRADTVVGGSCGFHGACGAGVGVGIFASLATGATPMARASWGLANGATAGALSAIAALGGPRCCKRTSWLALLSGIRLARRELGVRLEGRSPSCEFTARNPDCLERDCPFHPGRRGSALA